MTRRRSQMFQVSKRRRKSSRSSGISGGWIALFLGMFLAITILRFLIQFLQTPSGLVSLIVVIALAIAFFVWRKQRREQRERERIARLQTLGDILTLTPLEFEQLTGKILTSWGYHKVQIVGGSGDLGVDVIAYDQQRNKIAVQCKRYAPGNSVGSPAIQTFFGMMVHHQAQRGLFVTTSTFTQPAINLANARGIMLIDGNRLVGIVQGIQQALVTRQP